MVCSIGKLYARVIDYAEDNYHTKNQGIENSQWYGQGAEILGLISQVSPRDYSNAYQGVDSQGNTLRQRQVGKNSNPGRDITLSAPKSVSLLGLVKEDNKVIEAHQQAVKETLAYIQENCIFTRTGKRGREKQQTDNAIVAIFQHDDNRNQDPQLHSHCLIFNQTQGNDGKWRSMDNRQLYQQKMTIGMVYHHELAQRIKSLGYEVNWNRDGTFDVSGYTKDKLIEFSTRKQEIEKAVGIDADAVAKAQACTTTRIGKVYSPHPERFARKQQWQQKTHLLGIDHPQPQSQYELRNKPPQFSRNSSELIKDAIEVISDCTVAFEKHRLLREVLRQSQGDYQLIELQQGIEKEPSLVKTNDGRLTTIEAIEREKKMIILAKSGREKHHPLANTEMARQQAEELGLNKAQASALNHFVNNRDGVMLCQSDAGFGKTYTVKALKETISSNISLRGLVKSAAAAGELKQGANLTAQTLDSYLKTSIKFLPKNELIVVDEAGMIGSSQMKALLEKGQQTNSRILLIGDTKQLASPETGAPFKLLQQRTGLPTVYINQNVRQQDIELKSTVDLLAQGSIEQGYSTLTSNGKIKLLAIDSLRLEAVVQDYLNRDEQTQAKTLILAGTNKEKEEITTQLRENLISQQKLASKSLEIEILKSKDLDKFSLTQASSYSVGDVLKFGRNYAKLSKELYYQVAQINHQSGTISIRERVSGITQEIKLNSYRDRQVFESAPREIRPGEQMKFTRNQRQNKQINGQHFTVVGIKDNGQVKIQTNGKTQTVKPDALLYSDYRYVDLVGGSQGKTASYCIYAAGSGQSLTVGQESFYVAASRAKFDLTVYTASSKSLGVAVEKSRAQENALPLITITQPSSNQPSSRPTRDEEFQLLLAAKYLVENQGQVNPRNLQEKIYRTQDGTEIKRKADGLSISQQGAELKFGRNNATIKNTFSFTQLNNQIKARTTQMNQHIKINRSQTRERSIER